MNITIKSVNKVVLLLSACSALNTCSMEQDSAKVGTISANIAVEIKEMVEMCKKNSLVSGKDMTECVNRYLQQKERYIIRKCTNQSIGIPFNEKWRYETPDRYTDLPATNNALTLWENDFIRSRARECLEQHWEQYGGVAVALRDAKKELIAVALQNTENELITKKLEKLGLLD